MRFGHDAFPKGGGSATLSVTGNVPDEVAVMGISVDRRAPASLIQIDRFFTKKRNLPNTALPRRPAFSTN
jgi:hypothetical protein